jgi:hypothetical protein
MFVCVDIFLGQTSRVFIEFPKELVAKSPKFLATKRIILKMVKSN